MRGAHFRCAISLQLVSWLVVTAQGSEATAGSYALRGLPGVVVDVEGTGADVGPLPFKNLVELALRKSGIRVLLKDDNSAPTLLLRVGVAAVPGSSWSAYQTSLQLADDVMRLRDHQKAPRPPRDDTWIPVIRASTWSTGGIGTESNEHLYEVLRLRVQEHVDQFANEYLTANPR